MRHGRDKTTPGAVAGGLDVDRGVRDGFTAGMSPGQIEEARRKARERLGR